MDEYLNLYKQLTFLLSPDWKSCWLRVFSVCEFFRAWCGAFIMSFWLIVGQIIRLDCRWNHLLQPSSDRRTHLEWGSLG